MWLYRLLSRVFPRSFGAKIALVAALGILVPLGALVALLRHDSGALSDPWRAGVAAGAALAWTAVVLVLLQALLQPLRLLAAHLDDWQEGWHPGHLPKTFGDEPGRLMRQVNRLMDQASFVMGGARSVSDIDPLTGALNQRGLEAEMAGGAPGWVLRFGVDDLDTIRHRWGRDAEDEALRTLVRQARATLRPGDVLARLDDQDFVALLPALAPETVRGVAERLRRAVEMRVRTKGGPVTISVGLAQHMGGPDGDPVLQRAKSALSQARLRTQSRICEASTLLDAA
ncbi:GGDEF domain-containing protein [Rubellimicrobium roseum]|uniref:diguanylate cyclase n=1 Tax=Rubellimicrobium roseum TaxID=687525 RepID=A0A5C4NLA6_9RHOB|nr:GGDEF domain-containing protein [Rubellimicrobium roseum]TNC74675.1 GGDEF domain-containing protein [Rubellimicrobium roseum]